MLRERAEGGARGAIGAEGERARGSWHGSGESGESGLSEDADADANMDCSNGSSEIVPRAFGVGVEREGLGVWTSMWVRI